MNISPIGKRILADRLEMLMRGDITHEQYLTAVKAIYQTEAQENQSWEVEEYGHMARKVN